MQLAGAAGRVPERDRAPAGPRAGSLRATLGAAACMLLAASAPAARAADATAPADSAAGLPGGASGFGARDDAASARWQLDTSALLYGELSRTDVLEPTTRLTRLLPNGQTVSAGLVLDAITGASPTGALPTGVAATGGAGGEGVRAAMVHTITSASGGGGGGRPPQPGDIPVKRFNDFRGAVTLDWTVPLGTLFTASSGGHFSREKDYQSLGASGKLSVDLMQHLTTLTLGAALDHDGVFPTGGTPAGLDSITPRTFGNDPRHDTGVLAGITRVLTRRWLASVNGSRTWERGYLTEPYKVLSIVDDQGFPIGQLPEKRPASRQRSDVLLNSVYHLSSDVLYTSYRYYWDDWGVRSHTVDVRVRRDWSNETFLQPHVRLYNQTAASFFRDGFSQSALAAGGLPAYASGDYRLGELHDVTLGATYGFRVPGTRGEFTVRGEYMVQWGKGHPTDAIGVQRQFDLAPPVNIGTVTAGYSLTF